MSVLLYSGLMSCLEYKKCLCQNIDYSGKDPCINGNLKTHMVVYGSHHMTRALCRFLNIQNTAVAMLILVVTVLDNLKTHLIQMQYNLNL